MDKLHKVALLMALYECRYVLPGKIIGKQFAYDFFHFATSVLGSILTHPYGKVLCSEHKMEKSRVLSMVDKARLACYNKKKGSKAKSGEAHGKRYLENC